MAAGVGGVGREGVGGPWGRLVGLVAWMAWHGIAWHGQRTEDRQEAKCGHAEWAFCDGVCVTCGLGRRLEGADSAQAIPVWSPVVYATKHLLPSAQDADGGRCPGPCAGRPRGGCMCVRARTAAVEDSGARCSACPFAFAFAFAFAVGSIRPSSAFACASARPPRGCRAVSLEADCAAAQLAGLPSHSLERFGTVPSSPSAAAAAAALADILDRTPPAPRSLRSLAV